MVATSHIYHIGEHSSNLIHIPNLLTIPFTTNRKPIPYQATKENVLQVRKHSVNHVKPKGVNSYSL